MDSSIYILGVFGLFYGSCYGQERRIEGVYCATWGEWSHITTTACGATCGMGAVTETRQRQCLLSRSFPRPPTGCGFTQVEIKKIACDAGVACTGTIQAWGPWTVTGLCSSYCGRGLQPSIRRRTCSQPDACGELLADNKNDPCFASFRQRISCFFSGLQCIGYNTFIYDYLLPTFNLCVHGSYEQVGCPANNGGLLLSCGNGASPRCAIYRQIENICIGLFG